MKIVGKPPPSGPMFDWPGTAPGRHSAFLVWCLMLRRHQHDTGHCAQGDASVQPFHRVIAPRPLLKCVIPSSAQSSDSARSAKGCSPRPTGVLVTVARYRGNHRVDNQQANTPPPAVSAARVLCPAQGQRTTLQAVKDAVDKEYPPHVRPGGQQAGGKGILASILTRPDGRFPASPAPVRPPPADAQDSRRDSQRTGRISAPPRMWVFSLPASHPKASESAPA